MRLSVLIMAGLALACFAFAGCDQSTGTKSSAQTSDDHDDDGHDHADGDDAHDDEHAHGPNGGHLFKFAEGDYQGEWKHYSDNYVIRVYVLDKDGKKNQAVAAESVTIKRTTGDDGTVFALDAESPDADGKAVVYSLDSQDLSIAMNLGVVIEMKVGDKSYTFNVAPHEPHDH